MLTIKNIQDSEYLKNTADCYYICGTADGVLVDFYQPLSEEGLTTILEESERMLGCSSHCFSVGMRINGQGKDLGVPDVEREAEAELFSSYPASIASECARAAVHMHRKLIREL